MISKARKREWERIRSKQITLALARMIERRNAGLCPFCGKQVCPEKDFRDDLSRKEFSLSGLCQSCQDGYYQVMGGK